MSSLCDIKYTLVGTERGGGGRMEEREKQREREGERASERKSLRAHNQRQQIRNTT